MAAPDHRQCRWRRGAGRRNEGACDVRATAVSGRCRPARGVPFLYGPFAVSGLLLISTQFYTREVTEGYPERQTLWSGLLDPNWADVAMFSLLLAFGLVALAVCGAVRAVSTVALPVAVAVLALLG